MITARTKRSAAARCIFCVSALLLSVEDRSQVVVDYSAPVSWLCWPGRADACAGPLTATVISPRDGSLSRRDYAADPTAPLDCFYVYPTVSREKQANADMQSGPEEQRAAAQQLARFGAKCRMFAPLYRQTTVAAMNGDVQGADYRMPYLDVLAAWRFYLAHINRGRGVVLIGHSQGSKLLVRLLSEQFDGQPVQRLLVSAIVTGAGVQVPVGRDVGGTFKHIPLCHRGNQAGCVVTYSSYLASHPPGADAAFGDAGDAGSMGACVSPEALAGGGALNAELPTRGDLSRILGTDFVENPGLISGACATVGQHTFLSISIKPRAPGAIRLIRALSALDSRRPGWGLHAVDLNLALGDLVEIVGRQGRAWQADSH